VETTVRLEAAKGGGEIAKDVTLRLVEAMKGREAAGGAHEKMATDGGIEREIGRGGE
jgi:hypothetical protein